MGRLCGTAAALAVASSSIEIWRAQGAAVDELIARQGFKFRRARRAFRVGVTMVTTSGRPSERLRAADSRPGEMNGGDRVCRGHRGLSRGCRAAWRCVMSGTAPTSSGSRRSSGRCGRGERLAARHARAGHHVHRRDSHRDRRGGRYDLGRSAQRGSASRPAPKFGTLWLGATPPESAQARGSIAPLRRLPRRSRRARVSAIPHSRASDDSRPILERLASSRSTTTTRYIWVAVDSINHLGCSLFPRIDYPQAQILM